MFYEKLMLLTCMVCLGFGDIDLTGVFFYGWGYTNSWNKGRERYSWNFIPFRTPPTNSLEEGLRPLIVVTYVLFFLLCYIAVVKLTDKGLPGKTMSAMARPQVLGS
jgi:hypothetical protein